MKHENNSRSELFYYLHLLLYTMTCGSMVEALCYKPEGSGFDL
jgi:hypothetical protein